MLWTRQWRNRWDGFIPSHEYPKCISFMHGYPSILYVPAGITLKTQGVSWVPRSLIAQHRRSPKSWCVCGVYRSIDFTPRLLDRFRGTSTTPLDVFTAHLYHSSSHIHVLVTVPSQLLLSCRTCITHICCCNKSPYCTHLQLSCHNNTTIL